MLGKLLLVGTVGLVSSSRLISGDYYYDDADYYYDDDGEYYDDGAYYDDDGDYYEDDYGESYDEGYDELNRDEMLYQEAWDNLQEAQEEFQLAQRLMMMNGPKTAPAPKPGPKWPAPKKVKPQTSWAGPKTSAYRGPKTAYMDYDEKPSKYQVFGKGKTAGKGSKGKTAGKGVPPAGKTAPKKYSARMMD